MRLAESHDAFDALDSCRKIGVYVIFYLAQNGCLWHFLLGAKADCASKRLAGIGKNC